MQHNTHSRLRPGTQANSGMRVVRKPDAAQSIPPLLLDLDGTLVDSVYEHVVAWREALEDAEIRLPNWKIHRRIGMSGKLFLPALLRELGKNIDKAEIQSIERVRSGIFKKKIPEIRTHAGAKELLECFERIGARWAIATSGERAQVEQLLKNFDIPSTVPVITGDDVATAKPAPDSFVVAAQRLGVSPLESIVIGDSPWDLLAAQRMKALGVGLLCGGYADSELERAGAYRVYEDPADLLEHIEELGIQTE
ncbi:MAG: haloacid dehalogenase-like hydrolase [Candidatus Acidoferrum typicum]|nr:haloacid dehalogenase-like hydrolase [Candidatus Acidoferrum typicum]